MFAIRMPENPRQRLRAAAVPAAGVATVLCLTGLTGITPASAAPPPAGIVLGWGDDAAGQVGGVSGTPIRTKVPAGTPITAVAAGDIHSLALTTDGRVLAWGDNNVDELGIGSGFPFSTSTPQAVHLPAGADVTAITAGFFHSLAITSAGQVYAWGANASGQLGDGTTVNRSTPVLAGLPAGIDVTAVAAGANHSLALTSAGQVYAWGDNTYGELGNGTTTLSSVPVPVHLPAGTWVAAIAASYGYSLAVTSTGGLLTWGLTITPNLGLGGLHQPVSLVPLPVTLPAGVKVTTVAAGENHALALTSTGDVLAWGNGAGGDLGNGGTTGSTVPAPVKLPAGVTVTTISAGSQFSLALTPDGRILSWGDNSRGELGDGCPVTVKSTPVYVKLPAGLHASAIATGTFHGLAVAES